ncbi:DUF1016 N-terminal domain-containing protein [Mucilaginibacter antarcticus]|uniref:DUF1016 N-terminal domain-containing protein n=1 Tax=Mucilaginibacter antarcticus TaxID=1855725 RepID=UPI003634E277
MGPINNDKLFRSVRELIENARTQVVRNVNTTMLYTNYTISQMIVEEEQQGSDRAGYAETVVKDLNISLTATYGKGFPNETLIISNSSICATGSELCKHCLHNSKGRQRAFRWQVY